MRRILIPWCSLLMIFAIGAWASATPPTLKPTSSSESPAAHGVTSVTDGQGNPVPRETNAGDKTFQILSASRTTETSYVKRGREWWPFTTPFPPYTDVDQPVESLTEEEIQINGLATLNVLNPQAAWLQMPQNLLLETGSQLGQETGFYLVKIRGAVRTQEQVDALTAAGAVLGEFLNINTYIARISSRDFGAVAALPFVSYVGDYHPAYKISPRIGLEPIPAHLAFDSATGEEKPWVFEITLHKGASLPDVLGELEKLGIVLEPGQIVETEELTTLLVQTAPETVVAMARIPGIKWIAEKSFPRLLASSTYPTVNPMILQNNGVYTTNTSLGWKLWNAGIDGDRSGTAQIVTMMDTGLNTSMEHFSQDTASVGTVGSSHRKVVGYDNYGGDVCVTDYSAYDGGHGTLTSQHAVGSISNMTSNPDTTHTPTTHYDSGIASAAKVYFQDVGTSSGSLNPPTDLGASITAAIGKGSYIQNHSWGSTSPTYDTTASYLDTALFNNPLMVVTVAAGNEGTAGAGTIGSPCTAKNAICVGGADAANPDYLFQDCSYDGSSACGGSSDLGSSRGPVTTSNRVKPDICAYMAFSSTVGGENQAAGRPHAMCQTDATKTVYWDWTNSTGYGGTSFSAPEVAGLAALVRDYFQAGFYPSGSATPANAITPSGSLVKAIILASGQDMAATGYPSTSVTIADRYSNDVGYGRADLPAVLHIGSSAPFLWVQNSDTLGDAATKSFYFNINGNSVPLRVMLVWYDAAGNALQKDCDLKVTIGSTVYWGNNFSSGWSTSSTTTRDHTNNTEGVFLDASHGLPSSGTIQVDVIGYSNPGGMNYSLVVAGEVASQDITQVSMDKGKYTCAETVKITVNDSSASSPVSVVVTSKNSGGTTVDTQTVSCTGSAGVFTGTIVTGSGIAVVNGGSITATYSTVTPATAQIVCQIALDDGGYLIQGGCDNDDAGTDDVSGPLYNGGSNEFYNSYLDGGEYSSYTIGFVNLTGVHLNDVYVSLSFSGAGASSMTVYNNPVHIGSVPIDGLAGAVFQVYTNSSVAGLTSVNLDFDITSPADGYTTAKRLTQTQLLQANDVITRQSQCAVFNTALSPWYESTVTGAVANPWRWSGSASNPSTVGSETRTDGACNSSTTNSAAMVGNSGTTTSANFASSADSFLLQNFQPTLRGNAANGQPYYFVWKWHSFYHASEALNNQGGVWGAFYNHQWNSATNPTADQAMNFPIFTGYFYHTIFDYVGTWNWETANTGTPDDPRLDPDSGGAPNQLIISFSNSISGLATSSTYFSYGHEHGDMYWWNGQASHPTRRDVALDNERLVYDQFYAAAQTGASCGAGGQVGQVAFDRYTYDDCPTAQAVLSVLDADAVSPLQVTVVSPGSGDSEVVTLTGSAPYFSGTLVLATNTGRGVDNGVLFVLPGELINATYTDTSPVGSSITYAYSGCTGGDVAFVSAAQVSDNGDNDGFGDNNETVTMDITVINNTGSDLTNAKVTIFSDTPGTVDCIFDSEALYGTIAAGASATNPTSDRFSFHVADTVACSNWQSPPTARFTVVITADGVDGSPTLQTFNINLDLDPTSSGGSYTYNQAFDTNPGWVTSATPDDEGCTVSYANNFHWCAACGNGGGGYGAWEGDSAFGTSGQNYPVYDSSTLYSPVFVANGTVTLQFSVAYRTEATYDGAIVQYKLGSGSWTTLAYTTPSQSATTTSNYCNPLASGVSAWNGTGVSWTTTNAASVSATSGQNIQFRWRLGSDEVTGGTTYGGYGVDTVAITGLKQTTVCEPTRNMGLAGCCSLPGGLTNNTAADLNPYADTGVQITWAQDPSNWGDEGSGTRTYDVLRDGVAIASGLSYGTTSFTDTTGVNETSYTYSVRYVNGCGSTAITTGVAAQDDICTCAPPDQCHEEGVCNPSNGECTYEPKANGTVCTDGNACTQTDTCQGGTCSGANPVVCTPLDQCHDAGTCDTGTGICSDPPKANGTACEDGDSCTSPDSCQTGVCTPGPVPDAPTGISQLILVGSQLSWTVVGGATQYDLIRGGLSILLAGSGDFTSSTQACLANDRAETNFSDSAIPPAGNGFWYIVRAANCGGSGSYNDGTQAVSRDEGIAASPNACP